MHLGLRFWRPLSQRAWIVALALAMLLSAEEAFAAVESHSLTLPAGRAVTTALTEPASGISVALGGQEGIEIQVLENGQWSPWRPMEADTDASPWEQESQLFVTDNVTTVRLRSPRETTITLHGIAVSAEPVRETVASIRQLSINTIIPRWQWGADETLRIAKGRARNVQRGEDSEISIADGIRNCDLRARLYPEEFVEKKAKFTDAEGRPLLWPQGYSPKVNLFVIHHTAESRAGTAQKSGVERMRMLYQYHAVSRGWGDIGYNFVIDPEGKIYEGRAGGPSVVGAHAYCNNVGTIGIALMGNFQQDQPPREQLVGLEMLLIQLSDEYGIDPASYAIHHGKLTPTIIGHRDVRPTACPGSLAHMLFPQIRLAVKERNVNSPLFSPIVVASTQREASLVELPKEEVLPLAMGERQEFTVKFRNIGTDTWKKSSWILGEGDRGMFFTQFLPYSFVAGVLLDDEVPPGSIGTFSVKVQGGLAEADGRFTLTPIINNNRRLALDAVMEGFAIHQGSPHYVVVTHSFPTLHRTGEDVTGTVKILNSGDVHWEKGTLTELDFGALQGKGEVSILNHPERIAPGEQGTFLVRLHTVEEEGAYERTIVPRFVEGSPLIGTSVTVASRAEPLPAIALASSSWEVAQSASAVRRGRATTSAEGTVVEAMEGTEFTLAPREQIPIPLRIRAGETAVSKSQVIAPVTLSDTTITMRDEHTMRIRDVFKSPASLRAFQTIDTAVTLVAPRRVGTYTFSIGDIAFTVTVTPSARASLRKSPPRIITRRSTVIEERTERMLERRTRRVLPSTEAAPRDALIRIRLASASDMGLLTSTSSLRISGDGEDLVLTKGSVQVGRQEQLCKLSSADGSLFASVLRITPEQENAVTEIVNLGRRTNRFRGTLECRIMDGGLVWINELPLEAYLAGLAEEPDSEPYEKQRAFAVAARSYALFYVVSGQRKFPGLPYDGSDSPREFQAYGGVTFEEENPRWVDAVRNTAHRVLTWERTIVKAPYFSADAGMTNSALAVWGWQNTPYLSAKPDPWCEGMQSSGHGVGMSGCGAEGQANEGKTAEEILQYYYPGTKILTYDPAKWDGGALRTGQ